MKFSKLLSLLTLSQIDGVQTIEHRFNQTHLNCLAKNSDWSTELTRSNLIFDFWYKIVPANFVTIYIFGCITAYLFNPAKLSQGSMLGFTVLMSLLTFLILLVTLYNPLFKFYYSRFLTNCADKISNYEMIEISKCKKDQFPLKAIVIIQYILQKLSRISDTPIDNTYLNLMSKQYGVSRQGLNVAYQEIFMNSGKITKLRLSTEIENAFEQADKYFKLLNSDSGIQMLEDLKLRFLKNIVK